MASPLKNGGLEIGQETCRLKGNENACRTEARRAGHQEKSRQGVKKNDIICTEPHIDYSASPGATQFFMVACDWLQIQA